MLANHIPFEGLIAAVHTPLAADGRVNLDVVDRQAEHLAGVGVRGVFVAGTTGEGTSLTVHERQELADRWAEVAPANGLRLVVHVGHHSCAEAAALAAHAEALGASAIAAFAPSFIRPASVEALIDFLMPVAAAAPATPFYYYDIPGLSGVNLSVPDFLRRAPDRIPTLSGVKYTNPDLVQLQECLRGPGADFDILYGHDELLLPAACLGVRGAVGSTYNFAAPVYLRLLASFEAGDRVAARDSQWTSVRVIRTLQRYDFLPASKAVMGLLGIDCGPVLPPLRNLDDARRNALFAELESSGLLREMTS